MADEDYRWLDRDAAERLLSGESFDGADHHTRERAERLAKTLDSLTADERVLAGPPGDLSAELPGEAAALAAFREARGLSAGASSTRVGAGQTVQIVGSAEPPRPTRWGRPMRFGLAAVLAGCMIGGVAVAAGTGVLPSPFGGRDEKGPAASASPAAPPQPLESATGGASTAPDVEPDDVHTTPDGSSREPGSSAPPRSPEASASQGGGSQQPGTGDPQRDDEAADWRRKVVTACQDHRNGELRGEKKRRLEKLLGGSEGITEACNRVLGDGGDREGGGSGGSGGDDDGDNGGDGDKDGDGSSDNGGNDPEGNGGANPVPPIVVPTSPRNPTPTASYSAKPVLPSASAYSSASASTGS